MAVISPNTRKAIAAYIDERVNIPVLGDAKERDAFEWVVDKICDLVEGMLPDSVMRLVNGNSGIVADLADDLIENIVRKITKRIDLPFLNDKQEERLIRKVVELIVRALLPGKTLTTVLA